MSSVVLGLKGSALAGRAWLSRQQRGVPAPPSPGPAPTWAAAPISAPPPRGRGQCVIQGTSVPRDNPIYKAKLNNRKVVLSSSTGSSTRISRRIVIGEHVALGQLCSLLTIYATQNTLTSLSLTSFIFKMGMIMYRCLKRKWINTCEVLLIDPAVNRNIASLKCYQVSLFVNGYTMI